MTDFPQGTPLTFEHRGQYLLNDIYNVLVEIRDELRKQAPQAITIDTEPVLGLARKPGAAPKPKGRR